ncbi:HD domain-containing protein [Desulfocurvus sp. DL9XJH121]
METDAFLAPHRERLRAFALEHWARIADGRENIDLKLDHSLRVLDEALGITASLGGGASGRDLLDAVHLAALYHDMGRFPQFERWGTFNDRKSMNHGRLSLYAARAAGVLDGLSPRLRKVALAAILMHNRRLLPPNLPGDVDFAVRVVRDADKLDIYPVMLSHLEPGAPANPVVTLGLADDPEAYTPQILEQILAGSLCEYRDMRYTNDFKLLVLSWIYDLNFGHSRRALAERGYLERLLACLPRNEAFGGLGERLRADLNGGRQA